MGRYELDYEVIIRNVKSIRKSKNISQLQLSELADLSVNTISKFEINQKNINLETFIKIANALDVDVNVLLGYVQNEDKKPLDLTISGLLEDLVEQDKELLIPILNTMRFYRKKLKRKSFLPKQK